MRQLSWVTLLCCSNLVGFWMVARQIHAHEPSGVIARISELGGKLGLDEDAPEKPVVEVTLVGERIDDAELARLAPELAKLPALRKLTVVSRHVSDRGLKCLAELENLQALRLNCNITGVGLKYLSGLKGLEELEFICSGELTDEGLANLSRFDSLRRLRLIGAPQVTDATLKTLGQLTRLEELWLNYTHVSDAGLTELKGMTSLQMLQLRCGPANRYSAERIAELQRALPNCQITN